MRICSRVFGKCPKNFGYDLRQAIIHQLHDITRFFALTFGTALSAVGIQAVTIHAGTFEASFRVVTELATHSWNLALVYVWRRKKNYSKICQLWYNLNHSSYYSEESKMPEKTRKRYRSFKDHCLKTTQFYPTLQAITLTALFIIHQFVARVTRAVEACLRVVALVQTVPIVAFAFIDV